MITEAGTTEMGAAVLMSICKLRDRSPESESEIPTNGYSVFSFCKYTTFMLQIQEYICAVQ